MSWVSAGTIRWGLIDTDIQPYRPLHFIMMGLLYHLFGLDFHRYLLLMPLLHWLNALLFWRILDRILPTHHGLTMSAALLFLVYPGDSTRTIIGMSGHTLSLLLLLLAAWMLLRLAAQSAFRRWLWLPGMSAALLGSALAYDQLVPLAMFVPLLLLVYPERGITKGKFWFAAAWWLTLGVYALFRLYFLFFTPIGIHHFNIKSPVQEPADYPPLLVSWYRMGLLDAWYWALRRIRPAIALGSGEVRTIHLSVVFGIPLALLISGWAIIREWWRRQGTGPSESRPYQLYLALIAIGLAVAAITYLVVPLAYIPPPDTDLFQNRHHMPAGMGFGLSIAALIFLIAQLISRFVSGQYRLRSTVYSYVGWTIVSLFASIAILWQITREQYWQRDWEVKAELWRSVLEAAPDIEPETAVILHLADEDIHPGAFRGISTITGMLNFLYDDDTLWGDMIGTHQWISSGVTFYDDYLTSGSRTYPYDRVLFLTLRSAGGEDIQAQVLPCVPDELLPATLTDRVCGNPGLVEQDGELTITAREWLYGD